MAWRGGVDSSIVLHFTDGSTLELEATNEGYIEIYLDEEFGPIGTQYEKRFCERCNGWSKCAEIPLHGHSEWLCNKCAAAAYANGDAI
jgi:hypothetical protein